MCFKFHETFVNFSIFNGKSFQFPSCSFLGLDSLGYDSVFLYMSSFSPVIPFLQIDRNKQLQVCTS